MLVERFEVKGLAHYSYAVGDEAAPGGPAIAIVDPERNIDVYLQYAKAHSARITHVLETHIHADYASGARELAQVTGAKLMVSAYDAGELYEVKFPHVDMRDGESIEIGAVRITALHTPGHTPEHLSFLVFDTARSKAAPMLMLSGDFLFVGSLGRPDLLGEDAKHELAGKLFESTRRKLADLPDALEIYPAHGAGSMCGAGMGGNPSSTLGQERLSNPYLDPRLTQQQFIQRILGSVPPFPDYYVRMKKLNSAGPTLLGKLPGQEPLSVARFKQLVDQGHVVIDLRGQAAFSGAHIPRSFGIGNGASLATWAAWVVPYETPLLLVAENAADAAGAARSLIRVGLDQINGWLEGGIDAWRSAGFPLAQIHLPTVQQVKQQLDAGANLRILDVRGNDEWNAGHIEGAIHIMGGELPKRLAELSPDDGPIAVTCAGGYRSTVAASVLERAGFTNVGNIVGGMTAWTRAGLPAVRESAMAST
jgi:hydroxyacylglutathione hydrolase